jgi:three-Cys-motif partner protein
VTSTSSPAGFPESALRAVLAGCVSAWARSAAPAGAEGGDPPRLLYVDGFAGAELAFGTGVARAAEEETRAAAAIRALDAAAGAAAANALFVEEDPAHLQRVYADLERVAGGERLRATRDLGSLEPGEASLLETDFRDAATEVARFCDGARALFLLAPPTARKLPWEILRPLAARADVDLLIRFPHLDWEKQSRFVGGPLADIPAFARRIVEGASAMLGDAKHEWISSWRAAAQDGIPAALDDVLGRFRRLLESAVPNRIVEPAALEAGGATAYLFLVTSDPALALAFTTAARGARVPDRAAARAAEPADASAKARKASKSARSRKAAPEPADQLPAPVEAESASPVDAPESESTGPTESAEPAETPPPEPAPTYPPPPAQTPPPPTPPADIVLDLFGDAPPKPGAYAPLAVDLAALADSLATRYAGRTVAWRDVLADLAATGATVDEARRALASLKRSGRAKFGALKDDASEIDFPRDPTPPAPAAPRKRKRAAGDEGFFGQEE